MVGAEHPEKRTKPTISPLCWTGIGPPLRAAQRPGGPLRPERCSTSNRPLSVAVTLRTNLAKHAFDLLLYSTFNSAKFFIFILPDELFNVTQNTESAYSY